MACPHRCVYCNQFLISGQQVMPTEGEIVEKVERYLGTMAEGAKVELAFYGGTFTGLERGDQERLLRLVSPYVEEGRIESIRLSTRPDYIDEEGVEMLRRWGVKTVELGIQSLDEEVLKATGRGYGMEEVERAVRVVKEAGLRLGMQMMIGLPKDTKEKSLATARGIVEMGADNTRVYPTLVMRNTALARKYEMGMYRPLTIEEAVDWTKDILKIFDRGGVYVQRVGLHPTEGLMSGEDYMAGPFHVSMKEMALTAIWREIFEGEMGRNGNKKRWTIYVENSMLGVAAGYQGRNRKWLSGMLDEVMFRGDPALSGFEYRIDF